MDPDRPEPSRCSRAGCRRPALHRLEWRNPRIHDAARVKMWLACDEHRDELAAFLTARSFPLVVRSVAGDGVGDRGGGQ